MKLTRNIQRAINLASKLHLGQTRKGDHDLPYISHPFSVAWILSEFTNDEDVVIAGLLHDVLEDVKGYDFANLAHDFGDNIANIVKGVSEDKDPNIEIDEKATWEERKRKYLNNLENDSSEALMVCAADKIHNLRSMAESYKEQGEALWERFNSPADKKFWFYEEVYNIIEKRLDNKIVAELKEEILHIKELVRKSNHDANH